MLVNALTFLERFLYARAQRIIAISEGIRQGVEEKGIVPEKVMLISQATPLPHALNAEDREVCRRELGWEDKVVAIWLGAHGPANGLEVIVEAGRLLVNEPELLIVLVGDGPEKDELRWRALGLPNVIFYDPIPKCHIWEFLRAADIGLMVHRDTEAVRGVRPNKLFEYMAAGLPIITTMAGEPWSLVEEAGAGVLVPPEDPRSLAVAIKKLAGSIDRSAMGRSGFDYVSQHHTREQTARELAQTLEIVAQEAGRIVLDPSSRGADRSGGAVQDAPIKPK
jgi:glycosyltransferase involved in cell wall biosynthesis